MKSAVLSSLKNIWQFRISEQWMFRYGLMEW